MARQDDVQSYAVGDRPALVPDVTVRMAMSEGAPVLEHLLDIKTVRLGGVYNVRAGTHETVAFVKF